ncbi:MAG: T9SS type A sorting domain-containing protein [Bacteroidetes bacterium]|nr:T9SS type A sorting domain-containing protein [Bacteroidota bacterium]
MRTLFLLFFTLLLSSEGFSQSDKNSSAGQPRSSGTNESYQFLQTRSMKIWFQNNGAIIDPKGNWAWEYPVNSGKLVMYCQGFALSGYVAGDLRVSWMTPGTRAEEWQPGPIKNLSPEEPDNPRYRIYKVKAGDTWESNPDVANWPVALGAEWVDEDNNGKYEPEKGDHPRFLGDQMLWYVINDGVPKDHWNRRFKTESMGIEAQVTVFSLEEKTGLSPVVFLRYKLINKSRNFIDSLIYSVWSDPDLGNSDDDLGGFDSTRFMGYAYNENNKDSKYGNTPPAIGHSILIGPAKPTNNLADTLWIDKHANPGIKASRLKSGVVFVRGRNDMPDPNYSIEARYYQLGRQFNGEYFNPLTIGYRGTIFNNPLILYPGYPEHDTGWRDSQGGDRRLLMNSEQFSFAPGDTQVIYIACLIGQGSDNLQSLANLRKLNDAAAIALNDLMIPDPVFPGISDSKISSNTSGTIRLDLKSLPNFKPTFRPAPGHSYEFKGYRLRQLVPGENTGVILREITVKNGLDSLYQISSDGSEKKLVFTTGETFPPEDVPFLAYPDSRFVFDIERDALRKIRFINGETYEFGLTALYTDRQNLIPVLNKWGDQVGFGSTQPLLESEEKRVRILFRDEIKPDLPVTSEVSSKNVTHVAGQSTAKVIVDVVDGEEIKDNQKYVLNFYHPEQEGPVNWKLSSEGVTFLDSVAAYSGISFLKPIEGLSVRVLLPPPFIQSVSNIETPWWEQTPIRTRSGLNLVIKGSTDPKDGLNRSTLNFNAADTFYSRSGLSSAKIRNFEIEFSKSNPSKAYRYISNVTHTRKSFVVDPWIPKTISRGTTDNGIWAGFTTISTADFPTFGRLTQARKPGTGIVSVPFRVWDTSWRGPNGERRQLKVGLVENYASGSAAGFVNGNWDGKAEAKETILISNETYDPGLVMPSDTLHLDKYMDYLFRGDTLSGSWMAAWEPVGDTLSLQDGQFVSVLTSVPDLNDVFEISGFKSESVWLEERTHSILKRTTVYPNPYMGYNSLETSDDRFVTLINLPEKATIRFFTLNGNLIRKAEKDDNSNLFRLPLLNENGYFIASGIYLIHIEAPGLGTKVLKLAVIQREW